MGNHMSYFYQIDTHDKINWECVHGKQMTPLTYDIKFKRDKTEEQ